MKQSFVDSLFAPPHRLAINHATAEEIAFGTAINVAPIDEAKDDWIMLSPYGEFRNSLGLQIFKRENADRIVTAFNSVLGKLGRLFRGVPIYRGHPIQRPDIWPDDRRYGRIEALEARDDGLYGQPAWNSLGQENKKEGFLVYPSPGWHFDELGGGRISPKVLDHVGLTNTPNITTVAPVTNSTIAAELAESEQKEKNNMDKTKLIAALGLKAEATDDEILIAINVAQDAEKNPLVIAANTAKTTAETALNTAQDEGKKFKKLLIERELEIAINDGRLTAAELPAWGNKFEADFDGAAAELKEKQSALNTKSLKLTPSGKDLSDPQKRRIAFNARVDELTLPPDRGGKGMSLDQAISSMKADPEYAPLIEAMNTSEAKAA